MQYGDLIEFVDIDYVQRAGKVNAAVMWSLAMAPAQPGNVTLDASVLTNNSTLVWAAGKGATGYEVVWRPTDAPSWTHVVQVGNVLTAVLPLSKDDVVFGVRSIGAGGYRSPAVYPFPTT